MLKEEIAREKEIAKAEHESFAQRFKLIEEREKKVRARIITERGVSDQAQLMQVLGEYPEY